MAAKAKIDVTKKVVDRINLDLKEYKPVTVYVLYERISRICTFCGFLFHNYTNCPERNQLILRQPSGLDDHETIPKVFYGQWMTNEDHIPDDPEESQQSQPANPMIQRFVQYFSKLSVAGSSSGTGLKPGKTTQPALQLQQSILAHSGQGTQLPPLLSHLPSLQRSKVVTVQYGQKDGQQSDAATTPSGQVQVAGVTGTSPPQFLHSSEKHCLQQFLGPQQLSRPSSSQA